MTWAARTGTGGLNKDHPNFVDGHVQALLHAKRQMRRPESQAVWK